VSALLLLAVVGFGVWEVVNAVRLREANEQMAKKNEELENLLDINPQQYQRSPYQVKIMKVKPKIIYPKHEQDHAFLYSEASKGNVDVYNCSHTYMYGNLQSKDQLSISQRSQKSDLDIFT
jgi:hypothetical protein